MVLLERDYYVSLCCQVDFGRVPREEDHAGAAYAGPSEPHDNGNQPLAHPYDLRFSPGTYVDDKGCSEDRNEFVLQLSFGN